ncbi:hypothetical protein BMETH_1648_0 [methanotrophic bacterial endosymbiont of Bathymodiolus sp.]|nr:hypothetical protein BMETH_1648_0 [methanotrophic bacterial endosymbiont of Bathymodiolus sp.]
MLIAPDFSCYFIRFKYQNSLYQCILTIFFKIGEYSISLDSKKFKFRNDIRYMLFRYALNFNNRTMCALPNNCKFQKIYFPPFFFSI